MGNEVEGGAVQRCWGNGNPVLEDFHDREWGIAVHDDNLLYEYMILNTFQTGLTREQLLGKREVLKGVFSDFDPEKVALYNDAIVERIMAVDQMIQNKEKLRAAIANTKIFLKIQREFETFDHYLWKFTDNRSLIDPYGVTMETIPNSTPESDEMCEDLLKRGFKEYSTETCYAYMQNVGMANDHFKECFLFGKKRR